MRVEVVAKRWIEERIISGGTRPARSLRPTAGLPATPFSLPPPITTPVPLLDGVLDDRVRGVGTVDRFQGREGRFGFLSMATSTPETAPRGMVRRARRRHSY